MSERFQSLSLDGGELKDIIAAAVLSATENETTGMGQRYRKRRQRT